MTQPSQFKLRSQDTCSHPWPCTCTPRQHHGADMTQTTPLTKYAVDDLLGLQVQTTVYGHIIRLQATEYPGIPGPHRRRNQAQHRRQHHPPPHPTHREGPPMNEPTEAQVTAASEVLWDEALRPFGARVENFTRAQILAGGLRAADDEASAKNRHLVRRALRAALNTQEPR